jgi:hypothetical protein
VEDDVKANAVVARAGIKSKNKETKKVHALMPCQKVPILSRPGLISSVPVTEPRPVEAVRVQTRQSGLDVMGRVGLPGGGAG